MFNKSKKSQSVSKIIHLEIGFALDEITRWIDNDFKGNLLDTKNLNNDFNWHSGQTITYKFDLLPHPDGISSLFYHRHTNAFSNHMDAFDIFSDSIFKKFGPKLKEKISGVEWNIHPTGAICLWILLSNKYDKERENLIVVPTDEIFQLQLGNKPQNEDIYDREKREESFEEKTIEVAVSPKETINIKRALLGISGKGIGYRNTLCFVKAYPPDSQMDYERE